MATYINLENLSRYDMKVKARSKDAYADASAACWQKTPKAGAVTCVPSPESPLEPVVEFKFKEVPPASGDKSPSNPSTIEGVGEINVYRCANNLYNCTLAQETVETRNGIMFTKKMDGSIILNGTCTASEPLYYNQYHLKACVGPGYYRTYGVSSDISNNNLYMCNYGLMPAVGNTGSARATSTQIGYLTIETNNPVVYPSLWIRNGITYNNAVVYPHLSLNEVSGVLEPGASNVYAINLGNTYYGGTLDVASGKLTVTWEAVSYNGTETWTKDSSSTELVSVFYTNSYLLPRMSDTTPYCTHFTLNNGSVYADTFNMWAASPRFVARISSDVASTVEEFKTWLASQHSAGSPVTVCYNLAEPYTIQLDPVMINALPALDKISPRVNTIYTDAENVQVGYAEHPAYTEQQINNAILALGGNV